MNVNSVIARHDELSDRAISISGRLVGYSNDVFLVAEDTPTQEQNRGIFIARDDEFRLKYGAVIVPTAGGPLYEVPAVVTGVVASSRISPYPLEFVELRDVQVDYDGRVVTVPL